jgi:hypothetical protein
MPLGLRPAFVASCFAVFGVACGFPRSPDSIESRCAYGFRTLEADACQGDMRNKNPAFTQFQLDEFSRQCKDPESVARIQKIKTTCIAKQEAGIEEKKADERKIRAQYLTQVSELLLDPAYGPLVDRYKDLKEQAFHGDPYAKREAQVMLGQLAQLASKHGIDGRYGKELQLW